MKIHAPLTPHSLLATPHPHPPLPFNFLLVENTPRQENYHDFLMRIRIQPDKITLWRVEIGKKSLLHSSVVDPDPEPDPDPEQDPYWIRIQELCGSGDPYSEYRSGSTHVKIG